MSADKKHAQRSDALVLYLLEEEPNEATPYERLLDDAMVGDDAPFVREDSIEAAWAVVDPILTKHHRVLPYKRGSWGPKKADELMQADGRWQNPIADRAIP